LRNEEQPVLTQSSPLNGLGAARIFPVGNRYQLLLAKDAELDRVSVGFAKGVRAHAGNGRAASGGLIYAPVGNKQQVVF
jgi:hypothetical protein